MIIIGLRKLILVLFFSRRTPLHLSASNGRLEVTRLLVESKADVAVRDRCFSPPPSHHLSLTICLAALTKLHSTWPCAAPTPSATRTQKWLYTSAASARRKARRCCGGNTLTHPDPCSSHILLLPVAVFCSSATLPCHCCKLFHFATTPRKYSRKLVPINK